MEISLRLITKILNEYPLDVDGIHGVKHWARVHEIGARLAALTGADPVVVGLFSVFHDSQRWGDGHDPHHGQRGAAFARSICDPLDYFDVTDSQLEQLCRACEGHTYGRPNAAEDITVFTCWDADRLDLSRAGITPDPLYLCTAAAQDANVIEWAISLWRDGFEKYPFNL